MFRCGLCNEVSAPGAPAEHVVVEKREREYQGAARATRGWEIVREVLAHRRCAEARYRKPEE